MTDADAPRFAAMLTGLGEVFGRSLTSEVGEMYFRALSDMPLDVIQRAADRAVRESTFFPKPSELRSLAAPMRRDPWALDPEPEGRRRIDPGRERLKLLVVLDDATSSIASDTAAFVADAPHITLTDRVAALRALGAKHGSAGFDAAANELARWAERRPELVARYHGAHQRLRIHSTACFRCVDAATPLPETP